MLKNECCKQCRYVKFKGTMTKWPIQKTTYKTTQKHVEHKFNNNKKMCTNTTSFLKRFCVRM